MRRITRQGLAAGLVAATLLLAGCSGSSDQSKAKDQIEAPQPKAHAEALSQSFQKIERESFRFTSTVTLDGTKIKSEGAFDADQKLGDVKVDFAGQEMQIRVIGDDMYLQMAQQWLHVDMRKLPAGNSIGDAGNPVANADLLLAASDDVKQVGEGKYQGTLDLQKYLDEHAKPEEAKQLEKSLGKLGPEAKKVPFEATVDDQGRLTRLETTMTIEVKGEKTTVVQEAEYSDFGTKVEVSKPPADQTQEAPESVYKM